MLKIDVPRSELYNEETGKITITKPVRVRLEHSLISVSKWETIYEKPFLTPDPKTDEENKTYIRCMIIGEVPEHTIEILFYRYGRAIQEYIHAPCSATVINRHEKKTPTANRKYVSSEMIYSWMVEFRIDFEAQKWPLQRLMNLIDLCNLMRNDEKMTKEETLRHYKSVNEARRAAAAASRAAKG
jgi:hypothetical protein